MTIVVFYEKPGCANGARQKRLLRAAGHAVDARNLMTEPWTAQRLRAYFGDRLVAEWFNRAATRVKSGEIFPEEIGADDALALMVADPLLIRRPLMEADGRLMAGFDLDRVRAWIGLPDGDGDDFETCRRRPEARCSPPKPVGAGPGGSRSRQQNDRGTVKATEHAETPFTRIGGQPTVDAIVDAFYRRMDELPEARGIRAMHGADLAGIRAVLKRYLAEWLGGPKLYSAERGHPRLRMRHMGFAIGAAERDAWMLCMRGALEEIVPASPVRDELLQALGKLADWVRTDERQGAGRD